MKRTGEDLLQWLKEPSGSARTKWGAATINSYRTAVKAVLATQPQGLATELTEENVNSLANRFTEARTGLGAKFHYAAAFKSAARTFLGESDAPEVFEGTGAALRTWEFPLRPHLLLSLTMPVDLRPAEAERIALFVRSLPMDGRD